MDIQAFYRAVIEQNADALKPFFHEDAWVDWPCTNEHFTVEEYIRANCEYPGEWEGRIERSIQSGEELAVSAKVWPKDRSASFHSAAFIRLKDEKIASMTEYWGDDGPAPAWRQEMHIGTPME